MRQFLHNKKKSTYAIIIIFVCFFIIELILRLFGYTPHKKNVYILESTPKFSLIPHKTMGFALRPGTFKMTINKGLVYKCTHRSDFTRITRHPDDDAKFSKKPKLFVFGCSFTYGMGVDDNSTFPYLLQQEFQQFDIKNFAVPGYGTVQSYMQLKQELEEMNIPLVIILNYASMHDSRNRMTRIQQQQWSEGFINHKGAAKELFSEANFPYINNPVKPVVKYINMYKMYSNWGFSNYLALVSTSEKAINNILEKNSNKKEVSKAIIRNINQLSQKYKIPFFLAGIMNDKATKEILEYANSLGIPAIDISVDIGKKEYNHRPYDGHPNAKAHKEYAKKWGVFLKQNLKGRRKTNTYK